jgi:hypothetical protein
MRRGHKKPNGLTAKEKSQKEDYVIKKVIEACGDRIGTFKQNYGDAPPSDDEILAAFADCTDKTLDALLNIGKYISGKNSLFSKETLKEEAKQLILNIIKELDDRDLKQVARTHVDELLTRLFNYSKRYDVYVPLHGLTLSTEVDRVKFGDAFLLRMDESFFCSLGKQTDPETPKVELQEALDALDNAEQIEKQEYELIVRVEESQESLRRYIDYERALDELENEISALENDLDVIDESLDESPEVEKYYDEIDGVRVQLSSVQAEIRETEEKAMYLDNLDQIDTEMEKISNLLEEEASLQRRVDLEDVEVPKIMLQLEEKRGGLEEALEEKQASRDLMKQTQMEARRSQVADLEAQLVHIRATKKESTHTLRARIEHLKSEVASAEESLTLVNRFKDSSCLQYCYVAEWQKAKQFAERDAASIIDLLRYAIAVADISSENVLFGRQGEVVRDMPTLFSIESGTNDFQEMPSTSNEHPPLEITLRHIEAMKGEGIFEMAALLTKAPKRLNPIERIILRCIHWYSLSQIQLDRGSELLSLVIVLETLLGPEEREPIAATISECVAMLLDDSPEERIDRKEQIKHIYSVRSKLVHGKLEHDEVKEDDLEYLRNTSKKLISTVWGLYTNDRLEGNEQKDLIRLINQTKLGAPPIH